MKNIILVLMATLLSQVALAEEIYCVFKVYGVSPFIETRSRILSDGTLEEMVVVSRQGQTKTYSTVNEILAGGEKFKFTILESDQGGQIYVSIFKASTEASEKLKSKVTNPAAPRFLQDVPGDCEIIN